MVKTCNSNYYFSENPLLGDADFHVTTFRGRPSEKVRDIILKADNNLRNAVRKIFKKGRKQGHFSTH